MCIFTKVELNNNDTVTEIWNMVVKMYKLCYFSRFVGSMAWIVEAELSRLAGDAVAVRIQF